MSSVSVTEIRRYQYRTGNGYHRAGFLLIGGTILGRGGIFVRAVGMVLGSFIFRLVYTVALRFNMPAFMLKLVSSVIVVLAISGPYLKKQWPQIKRRMTHRKGVQ